MKNMIIAAIVVATFASCNNAEKTNESETTTHDASMTAEDHANMDMGIDTAATENKVIYTCPMHPEVQSDKPGKCPKCEMDLVVKK